MYEPHAGVILERRRPDDVVLDVGGWACPFNRANFVVDVEPYETRGYYATFGMPASQGGSREHFTRETWIQRDICVGEPLPFDDKAIDFAICSHTLEDVRDPLAVCRELIRVATAGYIEVPSREAESSRGWERPRIAGLSHHRWLVEIDGARVTFVMKYHLLHAHWRYSLPESYLRSLPEARRVRWMFWDGSFEFGERIIHGGDDMAAELERFVESTCPYPRWALRASEAAQWARVLPRRVWRKGRRLLQAPGTGG